MLRLINSVINSRVMCLWMRMLLGKFTWTLWCARGDIYWDARNNAIAINIWLAHKLKKNSIWFGNVSSHHIYHEVNMELWRESEYVSPILSHFIYPRLCRNKERKKMFMCHLAWLINAVHDTSTFWMLVSVVCLLGLCSVISGPQTPAHCLSLMFSLAGH